MAYGSSNPWPGSTTIRYNVPNSALNLPGNYWTGGNVNAGATGAYTAANTPMPLTKPITYEAPQKRTLQDNIGSFPDIESLTTMINGLQQAAQTKANRGRIPGAEDLENQSSKNIGSYLRGEVPEDVKYNLGRAAAERGVATGNVYGANSNAAYLRALGLESVGLMNKGQEQLTGAYARNPAAPLFDPSTLLITPLDREKLRIAEENARLEAERTAALQAEAAARQMTAFNAMNWGNVGGGYGRRPAYGSNWQPGQALIPPGYYAPGTRTTMDWNSFVPTATATPTPTPTATEGTNPNILAGLTQEERDLYDMDPASFWGDPRFGG